jgi:gas vesicle protein
MAVLARLLEGVNAADIGVLLALVWLVVRLEWTRSENATAHAAITKHIDGVNHSLTKHIDDVKRNLTKHIDDVKRNLTKHIDDVKRNLTKHIDDVKHDITKHIEGVKQDLTRNVDEIKRDVKMLLTGDVAWMQAVLRDRQPPE